MKKISLLIVTALFAFTNGAWAQNDNDDTEIITYEKKSEFIESYDNIETYVKNGMTENTYVVWVYYETKLLNIDTSAPGSSVLYVERNADDNSLRIVNTSKDKKITEYMQQLMKDEDEGDQCMCSLLYSFE